MTTVPERLATLEAQIGNIGLTAARTEANTKDILEKIDSRLDKTEKRVTKVETHLSWMKGIFAAVQAGALALLGHWK